MPILDVQIVKKLSAPSAGDLAQRIADAVGKALNSNYQGTWVKVQFLDIQNYAEDDVP